MWAGQRVLHLLQDLFKQGKLSLTLTLELEVTARAVVTITTGTLERRA